MSGDKVLTEREQIETLLPWYVVGTLTEAETKRVADYIAHNPELADQLALVQEEMAETTAANEALPSAPPGALGRLMEQVKAEPDTRMRLSVAAGRGFWQSLAELFTAPAAGTVRWVTAAAAVVILAQAVALGVLLSGERESGYETASGTPVAAQPAGTRLLVQFKPTASAAAVAEMLASLGVEIVGGPKPGGAFIIRVSEKSLADSEKDAMIARLKARGDLVGLVLPTE